MTTITTNTSNNSYCDSDILFDELVDLYDQYDHEPMSIKEEYNGRSSPEVNILKSFLFNMINYFIQNDQEQFKRSLQESHLSNLKCGVCGAPAHGYNFDQITCESCKAFFRRNALRNMVITVIKIVLFSIIL